EAARAPKVLAVGDLHVENFGTWRDIEGRLIWGINDFDETWRLPYTNDLIRLATSALLAEMGCDDKAGMDAILKGYREALEAGGRPFVLAEHHPALRHMATARLHDPEPYWQKLPALAGGAPDRWAGQPGAGTVRGAGRLARRISGARSQGAGALSLRVGGKWKRYEHS